MSADRAQSMQGRRASQNRKAFADADEFDSPEDVAQPETYRDETRQRLRDWIRAHTYRVILYSSLLLVAIIAGTILTLRFAPELWRSSLVRWTVIIFGLLGIGFAAGTKRILGTLSRTDWKIDRHPDGVILWLGEWQEGTNGFVAHRGFTFFGSPASQLEVGDLGDQYLHHQAASVNSDDDLVIGYPEAFTERTNTWLGTVAVTLTRGYDVYENGEDIHVFARAPQDSHREDLDDVDEELASLNRENQRLRNRIDDLKEERNSLRLQVQDLREQGIQDLAQTVGVVGDAFYGRRDNRQANGARNGDGVESNGTGTGANGYDFLQEVDSDD